MTFRTFMMIAGAIAVGFGVSFVLFPQVVETIYGMRATPGETVMGRYFGLTLIGLGLFCYAVRDVVGQLLIQKVLIGVGVSDAIGVLVSLHASTTHVINALGWFNVLLYLGLTASCVYLYRRTPVTYQAA